VEVGGQSLALPEGNASALGRIVVVQASVLHSDSLRAKRFRHPATEVVQGLVAVLRVHAADVVAFVEAARHGNGGSVGRFRKDVCEHGALAVSHLA